MTRRSPAGLAKAGLRAAAQALLGDYALNRVYGIDGPATALAMRAGQSLRPVDEAALAALRVHPDRKVSKAAGFAGAGVTGFALWDGGALAGTAFFQDRSTYCADRLWPMREDEAALVDLVTLPEFRGRGIAPLLIAHGGEAMRAAGKRRLFAWIWWTNRASVRAFEKAGWRPLSFVAQIRPFGRRPPLTLRTRAPR